MAGQLIDDTVLMALQLPGPVVAEVTVSRVTPRYSVDANGAHPEVHRDTYVMNLGEPDAGSLVRTSLSLNGIEAGYLVTTLVESLTELKKLRKELEDLKTNRGDEAVIRRYLQKQLETFT